MCSPPRVPVLSWSVLRERRAGRDPWSAFVFVLSFRLLSVYQSRERMTCLGIVQCRFNGQRWGSKRREMIGQMHHNGGAGIPNGDNSMEKLKRK